MTALFVFALPFALYGIAYGFYYLGRALVQLLPGLWSRFLQKKKNGHLFSHAGRRTFRLP